MQGPKVYPQTIDLPRIIGVKDFSVLQTWVDASYATHPDMRSHMGGVISLGHGIINSKSSKQKKHKELHGSRVSWRKQFHSKHHVDRLVPERTRLCGEIKHFLPGQSECHFP